MRIANLQTLTCLDYPGKVACTVFCAGCNFRCRYCHNPELVLPELIKQGEVINEEEILLFLNKRVGLLDGVCITGGEPLLAISVDFVKKIKDLGFLVKIDTNGSNPQKLRKLMDEHLVDFIAMDVKASPLRYEELVQKKICLEDIEHTMLIMIELGAYEFRTTVLKNYHDEEELELICKWITSVIGSKMNRFAIQAFRCQEKMIDLSLNQNYELTNEHLHLMKMAVGKYCEKILVY